MRHLCPSTADVRVRGERTWAIAIWRKARIQKKEGFIRTPPNRYSPSSSSLKEEHVVDEVIPRECGVATCPSILPLMVLLLALGLNDVCLSAPMDTQRHGLGWT